LTEDTWSFALGLKVVKSGVSDVLVHEVPEKLSLAYMITVRPLGTLTDDAQSFGMPLAAN
jgi:cytochrome c oxidase subunit IV